MALPVTGIHATPERVRGSRSSHIVSGVRGARGWGSSKDYFIIIINFPASFSEFFGLSSST